MPSRTVAMGLVLMLSGCSSPESTSGLSGGSGGSDGGTGSDSDGQSPAETGTAEPDDSTDSTGDDAPAGSTGGDDDGGSSSGGDPVVPPTCGVLADVPSEPGPHLADIEALGANAWIELGSPAADPEFGRARGRSWGGRAFALASDLRGAFFTGEGVHAYVKPDGYAMDDVWFYDINAHAWIAVHPGNEIATFNQRVADGELSIDDHGQLQDANGDPVPLHVLIHAWDFLTYDDQTQRFAFIAGDGMGEYYMPGLDQIQEGLSALHAQRDGIDVPPMSPWTYSTADCTWERKPLAGADPVPQPHVGGYAAFVYASSINRYVFAGSQGVALYERATNAWTLAQDSGPRPTGYDHGVAYDPKRNRLYMGTGDGNSGPFHIYDIDEEVWTAPAGAPTAFRTNNASAMFDHKHDVLTIFHYDDGMHYTYAPSTDTWSSQPLPPEVLAIVSSGSSSGMYDPVLNAYFVFNASDSQDNGTMLVYRHGV